MGDPILDVLISLLKDKKALLNEIYILSENQSKLIKNEEFEKLEDALDRKGTIIEKINNIDLKFKQFNVEIENKELILIQSEIKKALIDIKALDDKNNKKLTEAMDDMKDGIKDMRQGMKAMKNYNNSDPYQAFASQGGSLFIDQDS